MRWGAALIATVVLAAAGCGGGSDEGGEPAAGGTTTAPAGGAGGALSVAEAKARGGEGLTIRGFVFVEDDDDWVLCTALESSYPPICVEPSLKVANPDALADVELAEGIGQAGGLRWNERAVSLTGDVEGDAVTVSEIVKP